jgi:hypothetical protein
LSPVGSAAEGSRPVEACRVVTRPEAGMLATPGWSVAGTVATDSEADAATGPGADAPPESAPIVVPIRCWEELRLAV